MTYDKIQKHINNHKFVRRRYWVNNYYVQLSDNNVLWLYFIVKTDSPYIGNGYSETQIINGSKCQVFPIRVAKLDHFDYHNSDWETINKYIE